MDKKLIVDERILVCSQEKIWSKRINVFLKRSRKDRLLLIIDKGIRRKDEHIFLN